MREHTRPQSGRGNPGNRRGEAGMEAGRGKNVAWVSQRKLSVSNNDINHKHCNVIKIKEI